MNYIVISPVKDEERFVEYTLQSVVRQTHKPDKWIIVDDGSIDKTRSILERYAERHTFIQILSTSRTTARQPGAGVINAFNHGWEIANATRSDLLVKLDCDLSFEPDYFEKLIHEFEVQPRLGIASGIYKETQDGQRWHTVHMPSYHAAGACKVIRRDCFTEIGGFFPGRGWDTIDEIRAMARGWQTTHFSHLRMRHWKPEGSGIGSVRTSIMHGEVYYITGGGPLFLLVKFISRLRTRPLVIAAFAMLWGVARSALQQRRRPLSSPEMRLYRRLLNKRLMDVLHRSRQPI